MTSGCRFSVDAGSPVRATYVNLFKWPESDVEFVKSVAIRREEAGRAHHHRSSKKRWVPGRPSVVQDSYSCRQMYLRSYVFTTKKETVPERTRRCLGKVKERAKLFPFVFPDKKSGVEGNQLGKKKGCAVVVRRLREASRSVIVSMVSRILSCTTSVDVMDRNQVKFASRQG